MRNALPQLFPTFVRPKKNAGRRGPRRSGACRAAIRCACRCTRGCNRLFRISRHGPIDFPIALARAADPSPLRTNGPDERTFCLLRRTSGANAFSQFSRKWASEPLTKTAKSIASYQHNIIHSRGLRTAGETFEYITRASKVLQSYL